MMVGGVVMSGITSLATGILSVASNLISSIMSTITGLFSEMGRVGVAAVRSILDIFGDVMSTVSRTGREARNISVSGGLGYGTALNAVTTLTGMGVSGGAVGALLGNPVGNIINPMRAATVGLPGLAGDPGDFMVRMAGQMGSLRGNPLGTFMYRAMLGGETFDALAPIASYGRERLGRIRKVQQSFGINARNVERLEGDLFEAQSIISSFATRIKMLFADALMPLVQEALPRITDFLTNNKDRIISVIRDVGSWLVERLPPAIMRFGGVTLDVFSRITDFGARLVDAVGRNLPQITRGIADFTGVLQNMAATLFGLVMAGGQLVNDLRNGRVGGVAGQVWNQIATRTPNDFLNPTGIGGGGGAPGNPTHHLVPGGGAQNPGGARGAGPGPGPGVPGGNNGRPAPVGIPGMPPMADMAGEPAPVPGSNLDPRNWSFQTIGEVAVGGYVTNRFAQGALGVNQGWAHYAGQRMFRRAAAGAAGDELSIWGRTGRFAGRAVRAYRNWRTPITDTSKIPRPRPPRFGPKVDPNGQLQLFDDVLLEGADDVTRDLAENAVTHGAQSAARTSWIEAARAGMGAWGSGVRSWAAEGLMDLRGSAIRGLGYVARPSTALAALRAMPKGALLRGASLNIAGMAAGMVNEYTTREDLEKAGYRGAGWYGAGVGMLTGFSSWDPRTLIATAVGQGVRYGVNKNYTYQVENDVENSTGFTDDEVAQVGRGNWAQRASYYTQLARRAENKERALRHSNWFTSSMRRDELRGLRAEASSYYAEADKYKRMGYVDPLRAAFNRDIATAREQDQNVGRYSAVEAAAMGDIYSGRRNMATNAILISNDPRLKNYFWVDDVPEHLRHLLPESAKKQLAAAAAKTAASTAAAVSGRAGVPSSPGAPSGGASGAIPPGYNQAGMFDMSGVSGLMGGGAMQAGFATDVFGIPQNAVPQKGGDYNAVYANARDWMQDQLKYGYGRIADPDNPHPASMQDYIRGLNTPQNQKTLADIAESLRDVSKASRDQSRGLMHDADNWNESISKHLNKAVDLLGGLLRESQNGNRAIDGTFRRLEALQTRIGQNIIEERYLAETMP